MLSSWKSPISESYSAMSAAVAYAVHGAAVPGGDGKLKWERPTLGMAHLTRVHAECGGEYPHDSVHDARYDCGSVGSPEPTRNPNLQKTLMLLWNSTAEPGSEYSMLGSGLEKRGQTMGAQ
jgi:hypothetical protein